MGLLDKMGLPFTKLLELQDLGVLSGVEGSLTSTRGSASRDTFLASFPYGSVVLIVRAGDPSRSITLIASKLTKVGRQLLTLGRFEPNMGYISAVGHMIEAQGFAVTIGDIVASSRDQISFLNERPLPAVPALPAPPP
jgi:hypothetical protein